MEGVNVVFDLDGTLIDSAPEIRTAVNLALAELGLAPLGLAEVASFIGNGLPVLARRVREATGAAEPPAAFEARVLNHYNVVSREHGALIPGVGAALEQLRGQGWRLGLCTNKPAGPTAIVLDHLGINGLFGAVVTGDSLAQRKPDPAPLRQVLQALGPGRAIYVGDSEVDAETARRTGVPFALYTRGYRKATVQELRPDVFFDDYAELPEQLRQLVGQIAGRRSGPASSDT